jgi:hypothetical protein
MDYFEGTYSLQTTPYRCKKGHEFEVGAFSHMSFTFYYGTPSRNLGTTNNLCPQCVLDFMNENFTLNKVEKVE